MIIIKYILFEIFIMLKRRVSKELNRVGSDISIFFVLLVCLYNAIVTFYQVACNREHDKNGKFKYKLQKTHDDWRKYTKLICLLSLMIFHIYCVDATAYKTHKWSVDTRYRLLLFVVYKFGPYCGFCINSTFLTL